MDSFEKGICWYEFRLHYIRNWKFCLLCGPSKVRNVVFWCPPVGWLKFNVYGEAKGKPGLQGSSY